ncbi:sigma factor-like helix-turn-helix DNA-binding protein [Lentzea sp. CA-135723]|uniref:sigma factor-like helix-turn-helix DNA-binding protein n=1 Tax=Lentzea sp. CA-135723 TaxID=3239950 RepID=UPI003D91B515
MTGEADAAGKPEIAHADRLAADAELCARFRASRCQCTEFREWARNLLVSTKQLLIAWCKRGLMFKKSQATPWPRSGSVRTWDPEELSSLVNEVQARAFRLLRDRGINGGLWDPAKGASLRGYFLNGCVLVFAGRWKTWARHHEAWSQLEMHENISVHADIELEDSTSYEFDALSLMGLLRRKLTNEQFDVLAMAAEGYTNTEMSEILGRTPNTIAARLLRARKAAKKHIDECRGEL